MKRFRLSFEEKLAVIPLATFAAILLFTGCDTGNTEEHDEQVKALLQGYATTPDDQLVICNEYLSSGAENLTASINAEAIDVLGYEFTVDAVDEAFGMVC